MSPLWVPCPTCGVSAGEYCEDTLTGAPKMQYHSARER